MKGITLSNGHVLRYVVASGALAFDGKGWPWEKWLVKLGFIKPELFEVVLKTLTLKSRRGNFQWWNPLTWLLISPWSCMKLITGGAVNKVGLTNKGFKWWWLNVAPKIDFDRYSIIVSLYGTTKELVYMTEFLNQLRLAAIELNPSCPNTGHGMPSADEVIDSVKAVKAVTRHPVIVKVSVVQAYEKIAESLKGIAEAISLNSVPWEVIFGQAKSPLWRLEKRVGGGGGGVSGELAQLLNWPVVGKLARQGALPVICPDIMEFKNLDYVREMLGAGAVSFGTIHLPTKGEFWRTLFTNPCKPTKFVERYEAEEKKRKEKTPHESNDRS
ncbi:MAG: hypothetical protein WC798_02810 [Candidatus Paceibacterota bacterium]|jgi:dihydroorotate dehydrogenase